jgi:hypothetical protein
MSIGLGQHTHTTILGDLRCFVQDDGQWAIWRQDRCVACGRSLNWQDIGAAHSAAYAALRLLA